MSKSQTEIVRAAFSSVLAETDTQMAEVFEDFSLEAATIETQADHYFDGQAVHLIDQVVAVWREIHPVVSAAADIGGIVAILVMIRDRKKGAEIKSVLDQIIQRLEEDVSE